MRLSLAALLSGSILLAGLSSQASAAMLITVDKSSQTMDVSVDGQTRYTWPVSTGVEGYDTPSGAYKPFRMEAAHFSREWDNAPMPHSIFFSQVGHAIHGTNHGRQLGRAASHGCVRLAPRNAATLFALVKAQGMGNTRVSIEGRLSPVAPRREQGFPSASRERRYGDDGMVPARLQTGRDREVVRYRRVERRAPSPPYGWGYGRRGGYVGDDWE